MVRWKGGLDAHNSSSKGESGPNGEKRLENKWFHNKVEVDYNKHMNAVDKMDMILSAVECVHKSTKRYKPLFFHIVDMSILNHHKLYQSKYNEKCHLQSFLLDW